VAAEPVVVSVERPAPAWRLVSAPPSGRRVLVVDDNLDAADSLAEALRELGHEVAVVHDGVAALSTIAAFRPHVALIDIGLPVMDGYELARQVRQRLPSDRLRLVAITGYGQDRDKVRSRTVGFDEHLVKPVDLETVAAVLSPL
jgi:CheY-like chemotaxis protein